MNKLAQALTLFLCVVVFGIGQAATIEQKAGDWTVKLALDGDPIETGQHLARISVLDASGKPVTGAKVKVYYGMKAMSGMQPMNYKTKAEIDGDHYKADVNLSMGGDWNFKVKVKKDGESNNAEMSVNVGGGHHHAH